MLLLASVPLPRSSEVCVQTSSPVLPQLRLVLITQNDSVPKRILSMGRCRSLKALHIVSASHLSEL